MESIRGASELTPNRSSWFQLPESTAVETALRSTVSDISKTRHDTTVNAVQNSERSTTTLIEGLRAFAKGRYRAAERCYWKVLGAVPGHLEARAFLAETLILQRRISEAQRVLYGLQKVRGGHPALAFADSLRRGFEVGLYQRLASR